MTASRTTRLFRRQPIARFWTMALLLMVAAAFSARAAGEKAGGPLVDLDASALVRGPLDSWPNSGAAGGAFAPLDKPPIVAEIAGRRAVSFEAGGGLKSSFVVPDDLIKGKPFTLAVWAYLAEPHPREVIASWASRPNGTAEFAYGAGNDGAFFGWDRNIRYESLPAPAGWHHIAWSFEGAEMRLYVDGLADAVVTGKLSIKAGGSILLGAGWDGVGKKPTFNFKGALARVQIWPRALSHREIRNSAGWKGAFAPTPGDGATASAESLKLSWQPGAEGVAAYALRIADSEAGVTDRADAQRVDSAEFQPKDLKPGRAVYWRIDQLDAAGKVIEKGSTWRFTTDTGPASEPMPRHRVAGVDTATPELHWTPGRYAIAQTVYFGTDPEAVLKGSATKADLGAKAGAMALSAKLKPGTTYYWRVEQDNGPIPAARGEVWAFRTRDTPIPDDVTFFVSSDCHYGLGNNPALNRKVIDQMNWLPGTSMPDKAGGGIVRTPRGVVLDGDLLDKGFEPKTAPAAWAEFVQDYGLTGADGRLGYPMYEGFGNHDGMTGKSFSRAGIKERNPKRLGLTAISSNGFHYSWDWDQVHLVQLNLFPGKDSADCIVGPANHHPEDSLGFLKEDLAKNVADKGKIVIVFCHFCYSGGMADWWTEPAKDRFRDAVKGYRTILIHGHSHGAYFYEWKGLRAISDGAAARPDSQTGDFMVVHITKDELQIAQRKLDGWGITLKEPLPAADRTSADKKSLDPK